MFIYICQATPCFQKLNNWNPEKSLFGPLWLFADGLWSFVVICVRLLVVCGRLWVACFSNYVRGILDSNQQLITNLSRANCWMIKYNEIEYKVVNHILLPENVLIERKRIILRPLSFKK